MIPIKFATKQLKGKYCLTPFNSLHIDIRGNVNMCLCPAWQPTVIGNIYESSLDQLLDSPLARSIRESIIDGTYTYCNENQCPLLINDRLNTWETLPDNIRHQVQDNTRYDMPYEISFHGDLTCNLSCPSCRTHVIRVPEHEQERQRELAKRVFDHLFAKPTDQPLHFITSGSGEVFASPLLLSLLGNLNTKNFPRLKLNLHTNGLLAPQRWSRIEHLESNISQITVSIDAARAGTYSQVRRGGEWHNLLDAMQFIKNKKQQLGFVLHARMIVQQKNYKEIEEFYDLCKSFLVDRIEYSRLLDWRSWSPEEFQLNDVFGSTHPERSQAKHMIEQIRNRPGVWLEGDFN